ncbi:MAG: hypothetical protein A2878_02955 [Candidatus Moranbacteria bacterium RIFCSPHIGHO2_01_FULL_54_31]|nr:MAG: hypothetical protein A2878_02955 [Candidatus Moranbacteria bacterium RIFCSPHIGHO2_01_FULL_54_31]
MFNLRKKVLGKLPWLQNGLRTIFLRDERGKFVFKRYSLEQRGWIWLVFPRIVMVEQESFNLLGAGTQATKDAEQALAKHSIKVRDEIRSTLKRSASLRAGRVRNSFESDLEKLVVGTARLPSAIVAEGRSAIQTVHRSMVEAAGRAAQIRFEQGVKNCLAQMIVYARKEAGIGSAPDQQQSALPVGTRFVYYGDPFTVYLIEETPRVRTIRWDRELLQLSFPYVVFALTLEKGRYKNFQAFFRNEPMGLPDDRLHYPPLPDLDAECNLCFPPPKVSRGAPADIAFSAQQSFWASSFSSGHLNANQRAAATEIKGFSTKRWKELSVSKPLEVLNIPWLPTSFTVAKIGKIATSPANTFDAGKVMSRLEKFSHEVAKDLTLSIKEAVVEAISDEKDVASARQAFDERVDKVLREADIAKQVGELIRSEIVDACSEEKINDIVTSVGKKASVKVAEIISAAMNTAVSSLAVQLEGVTQKSEPQTGKELER